MWDLNRARLRIVLRRVFFAFVVVACLATRAFAERLPLKYYTSADGLASSAITHVTRDSRGFLWFTTRDGLSRFDGAEFISFRFGDNSAAQTVRSIVEDGDGAYWIAADDGLYRVSRSQTIDSQPVENQSQAMERRLNAEKVSQAAFIILSVNRRGQIYGLRGNRLFLIEGTGEGENGVLLREIDLEAVKQATQATLLGNFLEASDGSLWASFNNGAIRRLPDGRRLFYEFPAVAVGDESFDIEEDSNGRIWIGHTQGAFVFQPESLAALEAIADSETRPLIKEEAIAGISGRINLPSAPGRMLSIKFNFENGNKVASLDQSLSVGVPAMFKASDGRIWLSGDKSLYVFEADNYKRAGDAGILPGTAAEFVEDVQSNIWIGTNGGALRLAREGLTSYAQSDGLIDQSVMAIDETPSGSLLAFHGLLRAGVLHENSFTSFPINLPPETRFLWTTSFSLVDRSGAWWILTRNALYRFPPAATPEEQARQKPEEVSRLHDFLNNNSFYRAFLDRRGDIWFTTRGETARNGLYKYDSQSGAFENLTALPGYPKGKPIASFAEDTNGNFWFGFYGSDGLVKFSNGKFTEIMPEKDGLPRGACLALHFDKHNRLWVGSILEGLTRVNNPHGERLEFVRYTTGNGLASNNIRVLTEDLQGNIYAGSVRGVDRITPDTNTIRHFSTADGLAGDFINTAFRARDGSLWFGTSNGVSRIEPQIEMPLPPPPIYINGLSIAGVHYAVSEFGQTEAEIANLSSSQNNLAINFLSVGENLRYQFRLVGAANAEWSEPAVSRHVNFANLAPGNYQFLVRAVNQTGATSINPARISFTISPPFWRTWQFITLVVLLVGAGVFALDRYRVAKTRQVQAALEALRKSKEERLIELERVRARIATDLHDDIGSSLTQIAVLTEVARSQAKAHQNGLDAPLAAVSGLSAELMAAMGDIVWAINPRKDNLRDLVQRMRRFAADVFTARDIEFEFHAPDVEIEAQLGANLRREVYVIFKEAVNNVARHSAATRVEITLEVFSDSLALKVSDNGRGFDLAEKLDESFAPETGGNGLINLRRRGAELGGHCEFISFAGGGTTVLLEIPLHSDKITTYLDSENGNKNKLF